MANVLIVDDDEIIRLEEGRIIEQGGHTPIYAGDGAAAIEMYKENDIALVITDLRMPKMDGLTLIRNILFFDPEAAIIAVSSMAQHLDAAEEAGAVVGLVKPVGQEDLIERVEEILGTPPSPPPMSPTGEDLFGN